MPDHNYHWYIALKHTIDDMNVYKFTYIYRRWRAHAYKRTYQLYSEVDVHIPYFILFVISLVLFVLLYTLRIYIYTCIHFKNDQHQQVFAL